ncbi:secreted immunoglobulin domain 1 [Osmerus eperlanus]|uniref:secreted immunoglobulin domain 1 n=1 Tax=Osmerus eperlanus TaxID=29151 RepID=UPI002E159284
MKGIQFLSIVLFGLWRGESSSKLSVRMGENATLDCPLPISFNKSTFSWYKQRHAERPELILSYPVTNISLVIYGQGFQPDKFTARLGKSGPHLHQLLIQGSTESDTAVYYCGLGYHRDGNVKRRP